MMAHRSPEPAEDTGAHGVGAIIPAGGRARRLDGTPKPLLRDESGTALLTGILTDLVDLGIRPETIVVVGPVEDLRPAVLAMGQHSRDIRLIWEEPPFSGPAAAITAGMQTLLHASPAPPELVLTLAADMPRLRSGVGELLDAAREYPHAESWIGRTPRPGDKPRLEHLFALHRAAALRRGIDGIDPRDLSMRQLLTGLDQQPVDLAPETTADVDTWDAATALGLQAPPGS